MTPIEHVAVYAGAALFLTLAAWAFVGIVALVRRHPRRVFYDGYVEREPDLRPVDFTRGRRAALRAGTFAADVRASSRLALIEDQERRRRAELVVAATLGKARPR